MPCVSVVMTAYNQAPYVREAIDSVRAQTFTDWELIAFDDGSTDGSMMALHDAWRADPYGITINFEHPSLEERAASVRYATLINRGVRASSGEYITYLSGDDYYLPDRLERMVALLDEPRTIRHVVYGAQRMIGDTEGIRHTRGILMDAYGLVDLNSVMHTRSSFDGVGGWTDTPPTPMLWRCADGVMWRKLGLAGYPFVPVPGGPTDVKRYRPDSVDQRIIAGLNAW